MMTSSDEEERGMAFSHAADFEDGQWIDGEFYAGNGGRAKRGRRQTKEEQLYGVFGDES